MITELRANEMQAKLAKEIHAGISCDSDWKKVEILFADINPEYASRLSERFPDLTPAETRLACLIYVGLDTKHIARLLNIMPDSVKKARQRLRAKMHLAPTDSIIDILRQI